MRSFGEFKVETFTQTQSGKYDFLWVVDNSGSMGGVQTTLKEQFSGFLTTLSSREGIDYRMGVTTMDMDSENGAKGNLVGSNSNTKVISRNITEPTEPINQFNEIITNIGLGGSGNEQGLNASLTQLLAREPGFIRKGVPLVLIYISDEDDDASTKSPGDTEDNIINHLLGLGKKAEVFSVVKPMGASDSCGAYREGNRYINFMKKINEKNNPNLKGTPLSICNTDLAASFTAIASKLADAAYVFPLSEANIIESTLEVFLNGSRVSKDEYEFNPVKNTVEFKVNAQPELNDRIHIQYIHKP